MVPAAHLQDRDGATSLLDVLRHQCSRLRGLWADQAYAGELIAWVRELRPWRTVRREIVKRPDGTQGFRLLPKRWSVERTCAWRGRSRRLSQDYADVTQTSETRMRVAMSHLMVRRLARLTCL